MMFRFVITALLVCLAASTAAAQTSVTGTPSSPDIQTIVSRMMQAQDQNRTSSRPITVKRDYQLLDKAYEQRKPGLWQTSLIFLLTTNNMKWRAAMAASGEKNPA